MQRLPWGRYLTRRRCLRRHLAGLDATRLLFSRRFERPRLTPKDEGAESGRRDNVHRSILVDIGGVDVRTGAGVIVDQFGHELSPTGSFRIANGFVPVEYGRAVRIRIQKIVAM